MRIKVAKPLPEYRLVLTFECCEQGVVYLSAMVGRGVFAAWKDPAIFDRVSVTEFGAVEWPGGLDLCPDSLYLQMTGKRAEEVFPALHNRLSHA
jgi:hypothetical protein